MLTPLSERFPKTKAEKFIDTLQQIWENDPHYSPNRLIAQCNRDKVQVWTVASIARGTLYQCPDGSQFFLTREAMPMIEERAPLHLVAGGR